MDVLEGASALKTAVIAEDVARTRLAESEKARAEATAARQSATAAEAVAQTRFEQSEAARAEAAAISQFFVKIFRSPEPTRDGRTITVAEMLDRASVELETGLAAQPGRRANMQKTLGETYHALGLPAAAVPLLEGVKDYFIKTHGAEHPETLGAIVNLANSCGASGRKDEALRLREQALTLSRKIFGLEDPSTFGAMTNLAVSYAGTGRKEEAMKMLEEVVAFDRKALRPGHPDTLLALNNLALLYNEANRQNEGTAMLEEVLHHREKSLGHQHPDTLMALGNLANSYATAGHIDQALTMREQVLSSLRTSLGPEHPDTLLAFHNLAMSYDETGRKDEAKTLRQEVKAIEEKKQAAKEKSLPSRAQMQPYDLPTLRARANRQARFGQWKEAIADKVRVLELDPSDHSEWYLLAPLLVRAGDTDAYRKHRRDMIERFGATTDLPTMERTAKASLLLPAEGAELEMLGKLADAAVSLGQNHRYLAYFQFAQGLAQYRRGQFREAIVTQRIVVAASGVPEREVQAFAVLAMAHQHLGQSSEAHAALARGEEMGTALPPNSDDDDLGGNWQDVLIAKLLLQEAKTLLDEK